MLNTFAAASVVVEMHVIDVTSRVNKQTELIAKADITVKGTFKQPKILQL